jgi:hypothetical protein
MHGSSEGSDAGDRPLGESRAEGQAIPALARHGLTLGIVAGSDTHNGRPGGSVREVLGYYGGLVAVWAESLTRRSIFGAVRARRTYALTQARIALWFPVNDAPMGSAIPLSHNRRIRLSVWGTDEIEVVHFLGNGRVLEAAPGGGKEMRLEREFQGQEPAFYHCRVTQRDGNLAVCSPVWIGGAMGNG